MNNLLYFNNPKRNVNEPNISRELLRGTQEDTILSKAFFHPNNINFLQKQIIKEVFKRSHGEYLIEKQRDYDLKIVMRSVFLQYAKHRPTNIKEQIIKLDSIVIDEIIPGIITEIKSYLGYLDRAFGPIHIMDRPEYISSTGTKILASTIQKI